MKAPARHHGFTLLELILVMGIVALAAALAAPTLGNFARGRGLTDQARQLLAVVQYCQDQAVTQGQTHRLNVDASKGTYWITQQRLGAFVSPGNSMGRVFELGPGMTMGWMEDDEVAQRGYAMFATDGGHDAAGWWMADNRGRRMVVGSESLGEPYRVMAVN